MNISDIGKNVKILTTELEGEIIAFLDGIFHIKLSDGNGEDHVVYHTAEEFIVLPIAEQSVDEKIETEATASLELSAAGSVVSPNASTGVNDSGITSADGNAQAVSTVGADASATPLAASTSLSDAGLTAGTEGNAPATTGVSASESGATANPTADATSLSVDEHVGADAVAGAVAAENVAAADSTAEGI